MRTKERVRGKKAEKERKRIPSFFLAHKLKRGENMDKEKQAIRILPNSEKERKKENVELMENR